MKKTTKKSFSKNKQNIWFTKVRGSYLPISWQGWLSYVPFVSYLLVSLYHVAGMYPGWAATFLWILPYWVSAAVVMNWIAERRS